MSAADQGVQMHFFDRHDRFFESSTVGTRLESGERSPRLRYRYEAIIERNRSIYPGSRVLDLASHDGRWSLAALDAGADFVWGVEGRDKHVAAAKENFSIYNIARSSYEFEVGDLPNSLAKFAPGSFDVIMCLGLFYHTVRHFEFFEQFDRLRPKHIVLDTLTAAANGPFVFFRPELESDGSILFENSEQRVSIVGLPTHDFIAMLCRHFKYTLHAIDWHSFGIENWNGMPTYKDGSRRTYRLTSIEQ
jgi:SAM-dependent methyltransferase